MTEYEQNLKERFFKKRVKRSWRSLKQLWDRFQNAGTQPRKSRYEEDYKRELALRGTVTGIIEEDIEKGICPALEVTWDDGAVSKCLPYLVDIAED